MLQKKIKQLFMYSALIFGSSYSYCTFAQETNSTPNQVSSLINSGQFEQALSVIDTELKTNPKDPLLRFQRGISLAGLGKNDDAIVDFTKLTEEYPQLPEPYNNLAIIYSYKGQLDKSRAALEMAIKTNPNYVTAYDNLGDVYSKLAAINYEKSFSLDNKNTSAKSKLDMLSGIASLPIGSKKVYASNTSATSPAPKQPFSFKGGEDKNSLVTSSDIEPTAKKPAKNTKASDKVADKDKAIDKTKTKEVAKEDKKAKVEKAVPAVASTPKVETPVASNKTANPADEQDVIKSVNSWASSWSGKNVNAYLEHYSNNFKPSNGSKAEWESARKSKIGNKGSIDVTVSNPKVVISGDTATVNFKQLYKSDKFHDTTQKTLMMVKVDGRWKIQQEKGE